MADEAQRLIEPFDEHNQAPIDNVHPADWVNPPRWRSSSGT